MSFGPSQTFQTKRDLLDIVTWTQIPKKSYLIINNNYHGSNRNNINNNVHNTVYLKYTYTYHTSVNTNRDTTVAELSQISFYSFSLCVCLTFVYI